MTTDNPFKYDTFPPFSIGTTPGSWIDASGDVPGSRFKSFMHFGGIDLHIFASQVTVDDDGNPDGFTEWPEEYDALKVLDPESTFMTTTLPGVTGAHGEYVVYAYPASR